MAGADHAATFAGLPPPVKAETLLRSGESTCR
jgi:hypothetical protein